MSKARSFEELVDDIRPLIARFSKAQLDWLAERRALNPEGPYNEEVLIALIAVADHFAAEMRSRGISGEQMENCAELGRIVSKGIISEFRAARGTDA